MTEQDARRIPHEIRMIAGLVWMMAIVMGYGIAADAGYSFGESVAIGLVGPPVALVGMLISAWVLGTTLIWTNRKLGLTRLIP